MQTLVLSGLYRWYQKYVFEDRIPEVETSFVNFEVFEQHYREVLGSLADSGYDGIEGFLELPAIKEGSLGRWLKEYRLQMPIAYANSLLHDPTISEKSIGTVVALAQSAADAGLKYVDINPEPSDHEKSQSEISCEITSIVKLSRHLRDLGLTLTIHYHDEMMQSQARELHDILDNTDPELVKLTLDFHWAFRAGVDPIELLQQYTSRVAALHLRNSVNGIWTEALGDGEIDYKRVATILKAAHWSGLIIVELANESGMPSNQLVDKNHSISRNYVREIFGV